MAGESVTVRGPGGGEPVDVDFLSKGMIVIPTVHARIHAGLMYQADLVAFAVANNASIEILVRLGAGEGAHMAFSARAGGDANLQIFEGPTVTDEGTTITPRNRNRRSANTSDLDVFHTPTTSADGTNLSDILIPGGSGGNSAGGDAESFLEWNLAESKDYLIRLTNKSGNAAALGLELDWYEIP